MSGATSGYSNGTVTSLTFSTAYDVPLADGTHGRAGFNSLVLCTRYATDGDSGAPVLDMDGRVVGLHVGGSSGASFFCRIGYVSVKLGVQVSAA